MNHNKGLPHLLILGFLLMGCTFLGWLNHAGESISIWDFLEIVWTKMQNASPDSGMKSENMIAIGLVGLIPLMAGILIISHLKSDLDVVPCPPLIVTVTLFYSGLALLWQLVTISLMVVMTDNPTWATESRKDFFNSFSSGFYLSTVIHILIFAECTVYTYRRMPWVKKNNTLDEHTSVVSVVPVPETVKESHHTEAIKMHSQNALNIIQLGAEDFQLLLKKHGVASFASGIGIGFLAVSQPWIAGMAVGGAVIACGINHSKSKSSDNQQQPDA